MSRQKLRMVDQRRIAAELACEFRMLYPDRPHRTEQPVLKQYQVLLNHTESPIAAEYTALISHSSRRSGRSDGAG